MSRKQLLIESVCVLAALALAAAPAAGDTRNWRGAGTFGNTATDPADPTTQWSRPANWFGNAVPGSGDTANLAFTNAGYANAETTTVNQVYLNGMSELGALHIAAGVTLGTYDGIYVGSDDLGRLVQTGGLNRLQWDGRDARLTLGRDAGARGTYELSGGTLLVRAPTRNYKAIVGVGWSGHGHFIQSGGTHTIRTDYGDPDNHAYLYVGMDATATGVYELSAGSLEVRAAYNGRAIEYIGSGGTGEFVQIGGTNTVEDYLYLGRQSTGSGTYQLRGGSLTVEAGSEYVGYSGRGAFAQSSGTHTVGSVLYVGYNSSGVGTYELAGGALAVGGSEHVGYNGRGDFLQSGGDHQIAGLLSVGAMGSYTLSGGVLTVGTDLQVNTGGSFTQTGGTVTVDNQLSGKVTLGGDGLLTTFNTRVGASGGLTFTQDGGTHNTIQLLVAVVAGQDGNYDLTDGVLSVGAEAVGDRGQGTVNQSGGAHTVYGILRLGRFAGGRGTLNLSGGSLTARDVSVGQYDGAGTFNISNAAAYMEVQHNLTFGALGSFTAVPGAAIHMTGSALLNESVDETALAGLENLELIFEGGVGDWATFEVAGLDMDFVPGGFADNFVLGYLHVGGSDAAMVRLEDLFDNGNRSSAEALYVHDLTIEPGSTLDLNGLNLYYDGAYVNQGSVVGGAPVPEPAGLTVLGLGAAALILRRRRRT